MVKIVTVLERQACAKCKGTGSAADGRSCKSCGGTGSIEVEILR